MAENNNNTVVRASLTVTETVVLAPRPLILLIRNTFTQSPCMVGLL
ncbi:hypothetical protein SAMN02745866_00762 [Alteromonadaceae bacterium Bs31]|nr:hypothetical protein SAMN02745866_00762 [Alteromonadaceae bacterium Bs31]